MVENNSGASNVSVAAMQEVTDFMNNKFKNNLATQFKIITDIYMQLKNAEILSSQEIDNITANIQSKLTEISDNFDELLVRFNREMITNIETIETSTSNIENVLGN